MLASTPVRQPPVKFQGILMLSFPKRVLSGVLFLRQLNSLTMRRSTSCILTDYTHMTR